MVIVFATISSFWGPAAFDATGSWTVGKGVVDENPLFAFETVLAAPMGLLFVGAPPLEKSEGLWLSKGRSSNCHIQAPQLLVSFLGSFAKAVTE